MKNKYSIWNKIVNNEYEYDELGRRDLRIDFFRGIVMFVLVVVHFEVFSLYNFIAWERIGIISGGEGFVILSGLVVGMVYGKLLIKEGFHASVRKLVNRGLMLYRVNIVVIVSIVILAFLPVWNASELMTWTNNITKEVYALYPTVDANIQTKLASVLLLRSGPHQLQILGLYVILLCLSPLALWMMHKKRTMVVLGISWILYISNWADPVNLTGAQFEYAFPLLTWQLIFFHGMAAGFHRKKLAEIMESYYRKPILLISGVTFFVFMFFTQNNPNPEMPSYAKISIIPQEIFTEIYEKYCRKNTLGILRLVNYAAALIFGYYLLTKFWKIVNMYFGWFFIPLGQASLYVFIMHIYLLYIFSNVPIMNIGNMWLNTVGHTFALLLLWFMVKIRFLYNIVPR